MFRQLDGRTNFPTRRGGAGVGVSGAGEWHGMSSLIGPRQNLYAAA